MDDNTRKQIKWVLDAINAAREIQEYGLVCVIKIDFSVIAENDTYAPSLEVVRNILRNRLERSLGVLEIIETYTTKWRLARKFLLEINREKFAREYERVTSASILECGHVLLDVKRGFIQYKNRRVEISPDNRNMEFLALLMQNANEPIEYKTIARHLKLADYSDAVSNKDISRDVQFVRKELRDYLIKKVKMPEKEVARFVVATRNIGYKCVC